MSSTFSTLSINIRIGCVGVAFISARVKIERRSAAPPEVGLRRGILTRDARRLIEYVLPTPEGPCIRNELGKVILSVAIDDGFVFKSVSSVWRGRRDDGRYWLILGEVLALKSGIGIIT